ncbi:protein of unknown function [Methanoculleus bourgensis]|uniref:Uncharacterized protein n=1 Tax=Methanoculleus bourgensis TaxID=83986 RepID=A0A0X3BIZ6_9EURY|nr:protein of unknown function [Methanoculleus bourgensis]
MVILPAGVFVHHCFLALPGAGGRAGAYENYAAERGLAAADRPPLPGEPRIPQKENRNAVLSGQVTPDSSLEVFTVDEALHPLPDLITLDDEGCGGHPEFILLNVLWVLHGIDHRDLDPEVLLDFLEDRGLLLAPHAALLEETYHLHRHGITAPRPRIQPGEDARPPLYLPILTSR